MSKQTGITRRDFVKKSAIGLGLVAVAGLPVWKVGQVIAANNEAVHPKGRRRAWSFVIDLRKCEGCVTIDVPPQCLQACIQVHYIPKGEKWIEIYEQKLSGGGSYFMPALCYQCENAPCVNVCPVGATYHNEEGIVLIDANRCIGCRLCMAACPYQRRFFSWGEPELPPEAYFTKYTPEKPWPAIKGTVIKCEFCPHLYENGILPACVTACPMKALYFGDLDEGVATNGKEIVQLSKFLNENNAYRYKEQLGTQPRTWYIAGHGQDFGRHPNDVRKVKENEWPWGGDGWNRRVGIWPWGQDF